MKKEFTITIVSFVALMGILYAWFSISETEKGKGKNDDDKTFTEKQTIDNDIMEYSADKGQGKILIHNLSKRIASTLQKNIIAENNLFNTEKIGLHAAGFYQYYLDAWGGSFPFDYDSNQEYILKTLPTYNGNSGEADNKGNPMALARGKYTFYKDVYSYENRRRHYISETKIIGARLLNDVMILKSKIRQKALSQLIAEGKKFKGVNA